ncbi:hypothetical protein Tco_0246841 [Tanacetum coccineum]
MVLFAPFVRILSPVTATEIQGVEKERKAKNILLMAIPKEHIRRFHGMDDAKEIWEAIRTRFGGNANSKKMQKAVLKQQFKRDSFYQEQEAGKQEKNQIGLLTMDDGIVNWGEHTEVEETNHALMAISSSNEANEIYEKDEKLKRYRRIGMKAVKEKEQLQKTLDSWKDSSKNLWRLINSGMSSNNKLGLGCTNPLSGDYTPTPQEEIDESLYVYGKKGPQEPEPNVSDDRSSEYSTCQSNDNCDYYEKKMAREAEFKKQRVFNTSNRMAKPVWTNTNRINHANQFVPRPVQLKTGRPNANSVRHNVNTGRVNVIFCQGSNVNDCPVPPIDAQNSFSPKRTSGESYFNQEGIFFKFIHCGKTIVRITQRYDYSHAEREIGELYRVDTDDFMTLLLEGWSIRSTIWSIVLGEREEGSFFVINLSGNIVQYNLISNTLHEIYDCGSNQLDDNHELLKQFKAEHNVYELILYFASV